MQIPQIISLYQRVIDTLIQEIALYPDSGSLWTVKQGISNSGGNLCLHLLGNLNHFIGATLGDTGYLRNREAEFNDKSLDAQELIRQLNDARLMVSDVLATLTEAQLNETYPFAFAGEESTRFYLLFFYGHFQYHLGQVNYHRRLLSQS